MTIIRSKQRTSSGAQIARRNAWESGEDQKRHMKRLRRKKRKSEKAARKKRRNSKEADGGRD